MATWHQARTGFVQPHETQWTIVDDPPGNMRSAWLELTEDKAHERLRIWTSNGRDTRHCYILPPKGGK